MTVTAISAWKATTWVLGLAWAALFVLDPTVQVAIIGAIPATLALVLTWFNNRKITKVQAIATQAEKNSNDLLTKLLDKKDAATARADHADGFIQGAASERDKQP